MTKALTSHYFAFAVACFFVIAAFITATNFTQLALAALLYPILMFFAYKMYTKPKRVQEKILTTDDVRADESTAKKPAERIVISDVDKRVFLKFIGSAGVFLKKLKIFSIKVCLSLADLSLIKKRLPGPVPSLQLLNQLMNTASLK